MAKSLVVVESPAKAKTINKYLGKSYKVVASMGHIRDLPKSKLGVDVDEAFTPVYEPIPARKKVIKELRAAAKVATDIYVATDPDREGEAIGWHLAAELGGKKRSVHRLMFNEITKKAIVDALKHPVEIDQRMVDAQQARRVLDRLVGYKLSPLLWDKVRRGLSAGRVQSIALKLVCDREHEIEQFNPEEYWHIFANLIGPVPPEFEAKLQKKNGKTVKVLNEAESKTIVEAVTNESFIVDTVGTKARKKQAAPPYITSKLQQASQMPVKRTMMIAQQLYEGIELPGEDAVGLITYMRTDSTRVSDQALTDVREHIQSAFGEAYLPAKPNIYRAKKGAQDAHEAIRPTSMEYDPDRVKPHLTKEQFYIYRIIWNRFVASQMLPAIFDDTTVDINAGIYTFRIKGSVLKFKGWLSAYSKDVEDNSDGPGDQEGTREDDEHTKGLLPALNKGDTLSLKATRSEQKFTQPRPRFSEAMLVKELEENGIGRPSTYAAIIGVLQSREYVAKIEGRFKPTRLGRLVTELLLKSFNDILDVEYTKALEESLDKIEGGDADYQGTIASFYKKFEKDLEQAKKAMPNIKVKGLPSDETCDKCKAPMIIKVGRFGMFLACSAYPDCENTRELETTEPSQDEEAENCENCGKPMVVKRGRFGQFLACSGYPDCKTTRKIIETKQGLSAAKPDQLLEEKCPKCESQLVIKQGRFGEFTACSSYPTCKYVKLKSTGVSCPKDGGDIVERKTRRNIPFFGCSNYPDCDFTLWKRPLAEACPKCKREYLVEKTTKRHGRQVFCDNDECDYIRSEELAAV
ncbi:MAG: DNA topoisomerase I [Woeseiaceae bacterium]|nr:DNA topoisomerase I [Woeseiaceae bacterium]